MLMRYFTATAAAVLLATTLTGAAQADFAGTWILDAARSQGVPPGVEQNMQVTLKGDRLETDTLMSGGPQGEQRVTDVYVLDGRETDFKPPVLGETTGTGKRTSKLRDDKRGFDVTERAVLQAGGEEATFNVTRKWTLAADGRTLTIEMTMNGPQGESKSVRVFTRKS